tara:strand:+ start:5892 stop:6752 length:861 start_codon:yes stop_codon:yes gene_type:complete
VKIEFDQLIDQLDDFQKKELPWMASQTMRKLYWVTRSGKAGGPVWEEMRKEMTDTFDSLVNWTKDSLFSTSQQVRKDWLRLRFGHKDNAFGLKGNAAADYLSVQQQGGSVFRTRLMRRLAATGTTRGYWVADTHGPYKGQKNYWARLTVKGLWAAREFGSVKDFSDEFMGRRSGKKIPKPDGTYLYVPDAEEHGKHTLVFRRNSMAGGKKYTDKPLPPGVYKQMGGKKPFLKRVIAQLREDPVVPAKYTFYFAMETAYKRRVDEVFSKVFTETMAKWESAQKLLYG